MLYSQYSILSSLTRLPRRMFRPTPRAHKPIMQSLRAVSSTHSLHLSGHLPTAHHQRSTPRVLAHRTSTLYEVVADKFSDAISLIDEECFGGERELSIILPQSPIQTYSQLDLGGGDGEQTRAVMPYNCRPEETYRSERSERMSTYSPSSTTTSTVACQPHCHLSAFICPPTHSCVWPHNTLLVRTPHHRHECRKEGLRSTRWPYGHKSYGPQISTM